MSRATLKDAGLVALEDVLWDREWHDRGQAYAAMVEAGMGHEYAKDVLNDLVKHGVLERRLRDQTGWSRRSIDAYRLVGDLPCPTLTT